MIEKITAGWVKENLDNYLKGKNEFINLIKNDGLKRFERLEQIESNCIYFRRYTGDNVSHYGKRGEHIYNEYLNRKEYEDISVLQYVDDYMDKEKCFNLLRNVLNLCDVTTISKAIEVLSKDYLDELVTYYTKGDLNVLKLLLDAGASFLVNIPIRDKNGNTIGLKQEKDYTKTNLYIQMLEMINL